MDRSTDGLTPTTDIARIPELQLIRDAIDGERLLIVVGAGVSMGATNTDPRASWDGLLTFGLNTIQDSTRRRVFTLLLKKLGDSKSAIRVAEAIEDACGGRSDVTFYRWLQETVGQLRPAYREVLEAIRDLQGKRSSGSTCFSLA